ncbi:MAG: methyltransferase, partial [Candidatus Electrothrix sp. ATG1]|nr:methyltransferase [Candidatus Electrothrix sp. ATG1]
VNIQGAFLSSKGIEERKRLGQFFTGQAVSDYMAYLIERPEEKNVRLLDAGAGTGILTASAALHCLRMGCDSVHAVLYEIDAQILPALKQTLRTLEEIYQDRKASFTYEMNCEDFVLARPDKDVNVQPFDVAVINPPYFKYSVQSSPYVKATADLYHGDPNIYASFMAIVMACLKHGGQMVTITPRSFTNGLYFKGFRSYLLTESSLESVHIFKHRNKVFKDTTSAVLQENVICRFKKGGRMKNVTVSSSNCDADIQHGTKEVYPARLIIDSSNDQNTIRIPESAYEAEILQQAEMFETTFQNAGYFISTGRVVEHRTREYITDNTGAKNTVPLYRPHNVTPLQATWTGEHKKDVSFMLIEGHEKHTLKNGTYVLVKRFSSKDEKRRLVASVHFAEMHGCRLIGFGNKINYIGLKNGVLSSAEAYGLAAVFNSSFMDRYFRSISGNTQVNATEIRVMKFPSRNQVKKIGEQVQRMTSFKQSDLDDIVHQILGVMSLRWTVNRTAEN